MNPGMIILILAVVRTGMGLAALALLGALAAAIVVTIVVLKSKQ